MRCGVVDSGQRKVGISVVSVVLGLLGAVLILLCTSRYGVGLASDSANYLSAARSLLAGQGYRYFGGGVSTHFPPLFSTLLAIPGLVGVDPAAGARWLNALAFGGVVFFTGRLFRECTTSGITAVLGTLSVLLATPLLAVSSMVWSEAVFILLAVLSMLWLARLGQTRSWAALVMLSVLVGLACLQRYAGVTLILTGVIAIAVIVPAASVGDRLKYAVGFGLFSSVLPALWLLRNHIVAGQTTGFHYMNWQFIDEMPRLVVVTMNLMASWFSTRILPGVASVVAVGLILLLAVAVVLVCRWGPGERRRPGTVLLWSAGLFVLIYTSFIAFCGAGLAWDPDQRHMAPVYVFVMLVVFVAVEDVFRLFGKWLGGRAWIHMLGALLMALWLLHPLRGAYRTVRFAMREGAGAYSTTLWKQSALMDWLRANPLEGAVYSNVADALYLLAGLPAQLTPHYWMDTAQFAEKMAASPVSYVVWSHNLRWPFLYDLRELRSRWRLEPVAELSDGEVYRFLGAGGSPVFGVYRFWSPTKLRHLYTLDRRERDELVLRHAGRWLDEGAAFYVHIESEQCPGTQPVYWLWSQAMQSSFYTIDQAERDAALANNGVWEDRGVAWYAFAREDHPADTRPVHRFWSGALRTHFYTIDEGEKDRLVADPSRVWTYEGTAWYAYSK